VNTELTRFLFLGCCLLRAHTYWKFFCLQAGLAGALKSSPTSIPHCKSYNNRRLHFIQTHGESTSHWGCSNKPM